MGYATSTGEQVWQLQHDAPVTTMCLHPRDGSLLFSGSTNGQLTLWDLATGAPVRRWQVGSPIESLVVDVTGDKGAQGQSQSAGCLLYWPLLQPPAPRTHACFALPPPLLLTLCIAAYLSCHWRLRQAGRLFAFDLSSGAALAAGGRAKVSAARRLVVRCTRTARPCSETAPNPWENLVRYDGLCRADLV